MDEDVERKRAFAGTRAQELREEEHGLRRRLFRIRAAGWPLLVASILCPVAAGATALWKPLGENWIWVVEVLSLAGAGAAALHKALGCDAYQASLCRTLQSLRALVEDFQAVAACADAELPAALQRAEAERRTFRVGTADLPPQRPAAAEAAAA